MKNPSYLPVYEDRTECSKTLAYKIQMPGNYPEESIQHSEHRESFKSRITFLYFYFMEHKGNNSKIKQLSGISLHETFHESILLCMVYYSLSYGIL